MVYRTNVPHLHLACAKFPSDSLHSRVSPMNAWRMKLHISLKLSHVVHTIFQTIFLASMWTHIFVVLSFFVWYATKKNFNVFRLTLSLVVTWPAKILKFRLGSWEAGKFPVGARNFAQHCSHLFSKLRQGSNYHKSHLNVSGTEVVCTR